LRFTGIAALVAAVLDGAAPRGLLREPASVPDALDIDRGTRGFANDLLPEIAAKTS